eukprot:TRINITY_DN0_c1365_g1_i2.p1 TRINITY_DN0_c1365_g1~~TRINITY_DN0_c1365_g1_i2.p1  ORF type:complete len:279 (+),score=55.05 TRINITY_DN0_c1365_g1_i2:61-897(+)
MEETTPSSEVQVIVKISQLVKQLRQLNSASMAFFSNFVQKDGELEDQGQEKRPKTALTCLFGEELLAKRRRAPLRRGKRQGVDVFVSHLIKSQVSSLNNHIPEYEPILHKRNKEVMSVCSKEQVTKVKGYLSSRKIPLDKYPDLPIPEPVVIHSIEEITESERIQSPNPMTSTEQSPEIEMPAQFTYEKQAGKGLMDRDEVFESRIIRSDSMLPVDDIFLEGGYDEEAITPFFWSQITPATFVQDIPYHSIFKPTDLPKEQPEIQIIRPSAKINPENL